MFHLKCLQCCPARHENIKPLSLTFQNFIPMKKSANYFFSFFLCSASLLFVILFSNCNKKSEFDFTKTVVVPDSIAKKILKDFAADLEPLGEPLTTTNVVLDSANNSQITTGITSQTFKFYVDKYGKSIPPNQKQAISLAMGSGGGFGLTTVTCKWRCNVKKGQTCNNKGCSGPFCEDFSCGVCTGFCEGTATQSLFTGGGLIRL